MARNGGKTQTKSELDKAIDGLFQVPLVEFINERNALAARLKKEGSANDASLVKTLTKPSVSAWAVNQLYWHHRDEFDELLAAAQRLRKLQTSGLSGKVADMRALLDTRREALAQLSELASELLAEAGHSPTTDTLHRITTSLEAISSNSDNQSAGRLTQDLGPLGFDSLASMMAGGLSTLRDERTPPVKKTLAVAEKVRTQKASAAELEKARKLEESRQVNIAAAKAALQLAKRTLVDARTQVQTLEVSQKKAQAKVKDAEKQKRDAEVQFKKATFVYEEAAQRARDIAEEFAEAKESAEEARRAVERESKELEKLFGEK